MALLWSLLWRNAGFILLFHCPVPVAAKQQNSSSSLENNPENGSTLIRALQIAGVIVLAVIVVPLIVSIGFALRKKRRNEVLLSS